MIMTGLVLRPVLFAASVLALASAEAIAQPKPAPRQPEAAVETPAAKPAQIDRNGVLILIRTTLLALHQGNETGNYTVLRDLSAPGFRDANTAARLGEIFASQRAQKLDLSGVAVLDPQLTLLPQIEANGLLHMSGFFPSVPSQVNFELLFAPVDGRWKPFGLAVNVGSSAPTAPSPPPPAPSTAPPAAARAPEAKPATKSSGSQSKAPAAKPTGAPDQP